MINTLANSRDKSIKVEEGGGFLDMIQGNQSTKVVMKTQKDYDLGVLKSSLPNIALGVGITLYAW
jgi:hypothetical protein